ncbi:hypothetical protein HYFRA_00006964 [Hymenoscyphus fraxineus]|uniref:Thiamine phosphate synthase/TenI domain-containing protein n=1 Tax=Hymenoscyphus fraxineus TaxID=746836 RepID=A0A9N9PPA9_9HELO|nr:hypothetical protein HYFRA_00006964 [Hymenoscyphus fraxineus]
MMASSLSKTNVDYSLYLVTDSTPNILGDRDIAEVVEAALEGGCGLVQYRDKTSSTAVLVSTAKRLHTVTQKHGVPLLINDRVDVALAVGCEGVHIGQEDLDLPTARKLLGDDAIIGVTVSTIEEAQIACRDGADYLGIGTIFPTATKTNTKDIIGTAGIKEILRSIREWPVRTVCIGGINSSNIQRVLYQSAYHSTPFHKNLDGVALVSAIMAAEDPKKASQDLLQLIQTPPAFAASSVASHQRVVKVFDLIAQVPSVLMQVAEQKPLSHNMTNLVVQNFAANVALAIGSSPIMAHYGEEAADLAKLGGALVVNMGTVTPDGLTNYAKAIKEYNIVGGPVVFDPVGAGATAVRRASVKTLLAAGYFDVIKGNEGEIKTVFGMSVQQKGVDTGSSTSTLLEKATIVRDLAARERNVVLMTGATDLLSDGVRTYAIHNGCEMLGNITGSGCVLGTIISAMVAVSRGDKLVATLAGVLLYEIAAERAMEKEDSEHQKVVKGPGTFVPALIDELSSLNNPKLGIPWNTWLPRAKVDAIDI